MTWVLLFRCGEHYLHLSPATTFLIKTLSTTTYWPIRAKLYLVQKKLLITTFCMCPNQNNKCCQCNFIAVCPTTEWDEMNICNTFGLFVSICLQRPTAAWQHWKQCNMQSVLFQSQSLSQNNMITSNCHILIRLKGMITS